jgi:hypothetical protein
VAAASVVIVVTLTFQGLASFTLTPGPIEDPPFMWPFLDYPMYSAPWYEGDAIPQRVMVGVRADSSRVVIEPEDLDVTFWQFETVLFRAILRGDQARAAAYRAIYHDRYDERLLGFEVEQHPWFITDDGLRKGPHTVVASISFDSD